MTAHVERWARKQRGDHSMRTEDLVGTWILESFVAKSASGAQALPFGESPRGFLTYTDGGYMAAVLMRSGRAKFASLQANGS